MTTSLGRHGPLTLLAVLTFARIAYGVQFQSVGAVGPAMIEELGLNYASLGTLVGAYSTLGLMLSLPAGWLMVRLGDRRIVLASLGLIILGGALLAVTPGFGLALAGRLISGAGAVLLLVALPTIVAGRFPGTALSAAMGTLLAGYPLGIGLGFVLLPLAGSWRIAMAWTAVLATAALIAVAVALPRSSGSAANTRRAVRLGTREAVAVTAAGLVWGCLNAGFAVLLGFAPAFFLGRGMSAQTASALVSLLAFTTVPIGPLGGWLLGRLHRPLLGIAGGIALASLATMALSLNVVPAALLVAIGLALGATAGPIVALPAAVLTPEHRAVGMGLFWSIFFIPMTLLPPLTGFARDLTGDATTPLAAAAAFTASALLALAGYARLRRRIIRTAEGE